MAERILNCGSFKRAPEALTCRGSEDICKIIIFCIFCLKFGEPPSPPGSTVPEMITQGALSYRYAWYDWSIALSNLVL